MGRESSQTRSDDPSAWVSNDLFDKNGRGPPLPFYEMRLQMTIAQIYCSADEILNESNKITSPELLMEKVAAASLTLRSKIGNFIPIRETKSFIVTSRNEKDECIYLPPLLEVVTIKLNDTAISSSNYSLLPQGREWDNGPYIKVQIDNLVEGDEIEIDGKWGLYQEIKSLGITGSQAAADTATIDVTNGGLLSVGMVLFIEDEQELITEGKGSKQTPAPSKATAKANGAIDENDVLITVDDGDEFHAGEVIRIDSEDLYIEKISGEVLTAFRGWNGTNPVDHLDNAEIYVYRSFSVTRAVNGTSAAIHTSKAIYRMMPPADVSYMCRQVAILMQSKSDSGFQGRVGDAATGQVGFYSEFPPNQLEEIKSHYPNWE